MHPGALRDLDSHSVHNRKHVDAYYSRPATAPLLTTRQRNLFIHDIPMLLDPPKALCHSAPTHYEKELLGR